MKIKRYPAITLSLSNNKAVMKYITVLTIVLFTLCFISCKKDVSTSIATSPVNNNELLSSRIIHQTINSTITILPLPSRKGDILSKTKTFYLDMNGDKVKDFVFTLYWSRWDYPYQKNDASTPSINGYNAGDSLLTDYLYYIDYFGAKTTDFARAVSDSVNIKKAAPFNSYSLLATYYHVPPYYYSGGELKGLGDKIIGVRFKNANGKTHYGWIRVNVSSDANTITIVDYAYDTKANAPILAGSY